MTNYYTKERITAEEFYNTICENHIRRAKNMNKTIIHILVWNLTVDMLELLTIVRANGYNARLYKSRILVIAL